MRSVTVPAAFTITGAKVSPPLTTPPTGALGETRNVAARPAVEKGLLVGKDMRKNYDLSKDAEAQKVLFGQKARKA